MYAVRFPLLCCKENDSDGECYLTSRNHRNGHILKITLQQAIETGGHARRERTLHRCGHESNLAPGSVTLYTHTLASSQYIYVYNKRPQATQ